MGTLINSLKNIYKYIRGGDDQQENVTPHETTYAEATSTTTTTSTSTSYKVIYNSRKRTASFEPEITDDEDDQEAGFTQKFRPRPGQTSSSSSSQHTKRIRFDDMPRNTRSSGQPPNVEGLTKQPWEFNFNFRKRNLDKNVEIKKANIDLDFDPVASTSGFESLRISSKDNLQANMEKPNEKMDERWAISSSTSKSATSHDKIQASTSQRFIQVVTLDDEETPIRGKVAGGEARFKAPPPPPPSRNELALIKKNVTSPMKSRNRDCNRLTKALCTIGKKVSKSVARISTNRLQEKSKYKELLMAYNVMNSSGAYDVPTFSGQWSALSQSKVDRAQCQVLYHTFGRSPTEGAVSFEIVPRRSMHVEKRVEQPSTSTSSRREIVPRELIPKLFSTSEELGIERSTPKALTFSKVQPEVVDLETEKIPDTLSPISPVKGQIPSFRSPEKGIFSNLNEALDATGIALSEEEGLDESKGELEDEEEDTDISIIAEKVINSSRKKLTNTLALEQTLCPYVKKSWLDDSRLSYNERKKQREDRIREESKALQILRKESTLEKDLNQRIRDKLTLTEIIVLEEPPEELPELTEEMMDIINEAKMRGSEQQVLAQVRLLKDTIDITRGDVKTLGPLQWLNDNVINTYMGMIVLRSNSNEENLPKVYAFQTFFYPKLLKEGYSNSLKRWTRKDDIFAHDLIILPIHLGMHWCLACIDLRIKTIKYYDSLGGDNNKCLHSLLDYLSKEMKARKDTDLEKDDWKLENVKNIPQQQNGSDCGMFACKFAEYLSRDAEFSFTQEHMPYFRDRMIYELLRQDLLSP